MPVRLRGRRMDASSRTRRVRSRTCYSRCANWRQHPQCCRTCGSTGHILAVRHTPVVGRGSTATGLLKWHNLVDGSERTTNDAGMQKAQLILNANDHEVIAVGALPGNTRSDRWQISLAPNAGSPKRRTSSDSLRSEAQPVPGMGLIVRAVGGRLPLAGEPEMPSLGGRANGSPWSTRQRALRNCMTANHRQSRRTE